MARQLPLLLTLALSALLSAAAQTWVPPTLEEWKGRQVYQLLTDRFAGPDLEKEKDCDDFNRFCGGTYRAAAKMLPYIKEMGFDAVWISPVNAQTDGPTWRYPDGYHGYWPKDLEDFNTGFGTADDLKFFVNMCHAEGIWVMLDIVPNHMGYTNSYDSYTPFNDSDYFHSCDPCFTNCGYNKQIRWTVMECRLSNLPDLDQDNDFVANWYYNWTTRVIREFKLDALRLDAAAHINEDWMINLTKLIPGVYTIGEFTMETQQLGQLLVEGALVGALNFPLKDETVLVYTAGGQMSDLNSVLESQAAWIPNGSQFMGNFLDNHDVDRFLCIKPDLELFLNALVSSSFTPGIAIMYYGSEQGMMGTRDPLWESYDYSTDTNTYVFVKILFTARKYLWGSGGGSTMTNTGKTLQIYPGAWLYFIWDSFVLVNNYDSKYDFYEILNPIRNMPTEFSDRVYINIFNRAESIVFDMNGVGSWNLARYSRYPRIFVHSISPLLLRVLPEFKYSTAIDLPNTNDWHKWYAITFTFWGVTALLMLLISMSLRNFWRRMFSRSQWRHEDRESDDDEPDTTMSPFIQGHDRISLALNQSAQPLRRRHSKPAYPMSSHGSMPLKDMSAQSGIHKAGPSKLGSVVIVEDIELDLDFTRQSTMGVYFGDKELHNMPSRRDFTSAARAKALVSEQAAMEAAEGTPGMPSRMGTLTRMLSQRPVASARMNSVEYTHVEEKILETEVPAEMKSGGGGDLVGGEEKKTSGGAANGSRALTGVGNTSIKDNVKSMFKGGVRKKFDPSNIIDKTPENMRAKGRKERVPEIGIREGLMLHVAMEYTIPHLGYESQFVYGGLGKVVDVFTKEWPGKYALCCPLYEDIYESPEATTPKFANGAPPDFTFTVQVNFKAVPVGVYMLEYLEDEVVYIFFQAAIFRHRKRGGIYEFRNEEEMLTWLSVMNQAVAVILVTFEIPRVQFHDYHGSLSLAYLPPGYHPQVLYVSHNGHYNGTFPILTTDRKLYVYAMFDLDAFRHSRFTEHKGNFDFIYAVTQYLREYQKEYGVVAVSPRYADQICSKLSAYWRLKRSKVTGIMNGLPLINCLASEMDSGKMDFEGAVAFKKDAKARFQERFGLDVGEQYSLVIFLGRMTHQKGCDIIALAADDFLKACPLCQLVMVGPVGDLMGKEAQETLAAVSPNYPGRVYAPPGKYFSGEEKELLLAAADFCLVPSRFEPCGLVDIELGWNGAIVIGHDTGGLGKMPGVYFTVETAAQAHLAVKLADAVKKAMALSPEKRRQMMQEALEKRFDTAEMMQNYEDHWMLIDDAVHQRNKEREEKEQKLASHDQFYEDLWRLKNVQDLTDDELADMNNTVLTFWGRAYTKQWISNVLLMLMQGLCLLPGTLVMAYAVFVEVAVDTIIGCRRLWDHSFDVWGSDAFVSLDARVVMYFGALAIFAPLWVFIMVNMRPKHFIRLACTINFICIVFVSAAILWTEALSIAVIVAGCTSPAGLGFLALGFLGQEQEISEVGLGYLTVVEAATGIAIFVTGILAGTASGKEAFMVVTGFAVLTLGLICAWFWNDVLDHAYAHWRLVFKGQWYLLTRLKTFWFTIMANACDWIGILILGLAILIEFGLKNYMQALAVFWGVHVLSLPVWYFFLNTKFAQMHVQRWTLALSTTPILIIVPVCVAAYCNKDHFEYVLIAVALVVFFSSIRINLLGLLAFQTLPTREVVTMWQMGNILLSSLVLVAVIIASMTTSNTVMHVNQATWGAALAEGVRLICMAVVWWFQPKENLATL